MILDSCVENDIDYQGNTIKTYPNTESRMECLNFCQSDDNCKAWTYGVSGEWTGNCVLKSSESGRLSYPGLISGPKFCQRCDIMGICVVSSYYLACSYRLINNLLNFLFLNSSSFQKLHDPWTDPK